MKGGTEVARISRGFQGRRPQVDPDRVPPGQYVTRDFPVLSAGPTPHTPLERVDLRDPGAVGQAAPGHGRSSWRCRPRRSPCDIHCVTKWSKLDTRWKGVSLDTLLERSRAEGEARARVLRRRLHDEPAARGPDRRQAWIAYEYDGEPLEPSTAARPGCSSPTSTSGRAPSGCAGSSSATTTSPASGRATATTTTATPGRSSGTGATDAVAPRRARSACTSRPSATPAPNHRAPSIDLGAAGRPPRRPARRRAPDRRGRLPGVALVLDRIGAGSTTPSS